MGFVDAQGKTVIDFTFMGTSIALREDEIKKDRTGRSPVTRRRVRGLYHTFSDGLANVLLSPIERPPVPMTYETSNGVIDREGNMLFRYKGAAGLAENGFIHVWDYKKLILIDRLGVQYERAMPFGVRLMAITDWSGPTQGIIGVREVVPSGQHGRYGYIKFTIKKGEDK